MPSLLPLLLALAAPQQAGDCTAGGLVCRHIGTVHVETPDGKGADIPVDRDFPWVVEENIMLFPGESVTVTLAQRDGYLAPVLARAGAASAATNPAAGEVRFSLSQSDKGSLNLVVESNYAQPLDYAALMVTEPGGPQRTSVCTLNRGIAVFENWQAPLVQLALWHFVPSSEPGCKTLDFGKGKKAAS